MDQFCSTRFLVDSDKNNVSEYLWKLGTLLSELNEQTRMKDPVRYIHMKGRISRFKIRISRNKIPQPSKCIAMLEAKIFNNM